MIGGMLEWGKSNRPEIAISILVQLDLFVISPNFPFDWLQFCALFPLWADKHTVKEV